MSLDELRKQINDIDNKLVELLNQRANIVIDIGKLKNKTAAPVYSPDREKEVFERIAKANTLFTVERGVITADFANSVAV